MVFNYRLIIVNINKMILENEIKIIQHLSKNIISNFLQIGIKLKKIRDEESFRSEYSTFTEFLEKEEFTFSKQFVYRLFQIVEDRELKVKAPLLGITKTIELLYVTERETRNELMEKTIKEDLTHKELRTEIKKLKVEHNPVIDIKSERFFKLKREAVNMMSELKRIKEQYLIWKEKSKEFDLKKEKEELSLCFALEEKK